jgi:hypothetical protein
MKKTLHIIGMIVGVAAITLLMSACNNSPKKDQGLTLAAADTVGLAAFQNWKVQNERKDPNMYYGMPVNQTAPAPVRTVTTRPVAKPKATTTTTKSQPAKKKGWSKAAKGAAIGAGAGAIAGVLINKKNRALGGVIGGVLGGAVGYGIGRDMDKKDGRY